MQRFASASDYRALLLDAIQRPSHGGLFYAKVIVDFCGRDQTAYSELLADSQQRSLRSSGTLSQAQLSAIEKFLRRCASFAPGETSDFQRRVDSLAPSESDPLVQARQGLREALRSGDSALRASSLTTLLAHGDPLALSDQDALLRAQIRRSADQPEYILLGGRQYSRTSNAYWAASFALELGACTGSGVCKLDEDMLLACGMRGVCMSSTEDFVTQQMSELKLDAIMIKSAVALGAQVRKAILSKDLSFFTRLE